MANQLLTSAILGVNQPWTQWPPPVAAMPLMHGHQPAATAARTNPQQQDQTANGGSSGNGQLETQATDS
jgi:hypothetical protein